jgi:plasmid stabilization system protein ParE
MDYQVIWDKEAIEELGQLVGYIARHNPAAARKMGETLLHKAGGLRQFPELGKVFRELNRRNVREISVPPYRIIYQVKESEHSVRILKVWHGARREPEIK